MPRVCFKPITWYIEMHFLVCRVMTFSVLTWCSFTTCLPSRGKLIVVFVCHRSVSMAAVYELKIKYVQDKFRVILLEAKRPQGPVSFPLENKHVVNEHHVVRKSHDATQKKCRHVMHFNVPRDWFETNLRHQKRYSEGYRGLLGRVIITN